MALEERATRALIDSLLSGAYNENPYEKEKNTYAKSEKNKERER